MSREQTDTNSQFDDEISNGTYKFEVVKVVRKEIKGKKAYEWELEYKNADKVDMIGKQLFWPNQISGLLRVLKCKETTPGVFDWDTDLMEGKEFIATIAREPSKKDLSKSYQIMIDFKEVEKDDIPF